MDEKYQNYFNESNEFENIPEIFAAFFKDAKINTNKNKNVITTCKITKQQAKTGLNKNMKISVADICDTCRGTGKNEENKTTIYKNCYNNENEENNQHTISKQPAPEKTYNNHQCKNCYGTGYTYNEKDITINIPPKTKNNDYIIFKEKGNKFKLNEERGNLLIKIHIYGNNSKRKGKMIKENL